MADRKPFSWEQERGASNRHERRANLKTKTTRAARVAIKRAFESFKTDPTKPAMITIENGAKKP